MCRPSCCKSSGEGTGIAAVAVIGTVVFVAVKIGPIVARILHTIVEVFAILTLTAAGVLTCLLIGWLTVHIVRWRNRQHPHRNVSWRPSSVPPSRHIGLADGDPPDCIACGDKGTVLRAIGSSRYQATSCPVCEPAAKAG